MKIKAGVLRYAVPANLLAMLLQLLQKRFVILRLFCKDGVDDSAQVVTVAFSRRVDDALLSFPIRLVLDGGELVLQTCKSGVSMTVKTV